MQQKDKIGNWLNHAGNRVICIVGSIIFLFLCWNSFRYTRYIPVGGAEIPLNVADSMKQNLLVLLLAAAVIWGLMFLEGKLSAKQRKIVEAVFLVLSVCLIAGASFWWICAVPRTPGSDQMHVCSDASNFMQGNYESLAKGYYCERYPQQLGLIAMLELVYTVAGRDNNFAFEVISAVMAPFIVLFGYHIVKRITRSMAASVGYCLLMMGCLPLVFYTSWVYGEIPSIFFSLLAVSLAMRYHDKRHWGYLIGIVACFAFAMLVRKNSVILMIAFCLTALLCGIREKDKKLLTTAVCAIVIPYLAFAGIQQMYEIRSGYEKSRGLPASSWFSLGLMEIEGRCGWDNGIYQGEVYFNEEYDWEAADAAYREDIRESLEKFREQPSYAVYFFREKMLSQWNLPMYQSFYFGQPVTTEDLPEDSLFMKLREDYFVVLLRICDRLQFVLYVGMLLYFLFAVRKDSHVLHHVLPVMVIGGFLFSVIWEAKARYIFPYYMAMFPMAVIGYRQCILAAEALLSRIRH